MSALDGRPPHGSQDREPNPLVEIERAVQDAADAAGIDGTGPGRERLAALVDSEISRWNDDARRGRRPYPLADPAAVRDRVMRNLTGYGPLDPLLADEDTWEIMINAPDAIFVRRHRGPSGYHHEVFHDGAHLVRTLTRLLDDATGSHRALDPSEGLQDALLGDGARIHIVHADLSRTGHPLVNIRKFTGVAYRSLDQLVSLGMLSPAAADLLRACVAARLSIVYAGPPGSGKTTLLSCCAAELDPTLRVVVAEEVFETDIGLPNVAHMQTRPHRPERPGVGLRRLVAGFLRMAPDVAIVGEVRDTEALPLLLTLSSGVTGYTTIHAPSARRALSRLRFIAQLSDGGDAIGPAALTSLVADAVDIVVHCERRDGRPVVTEVVAVEDATTSDSHQFTVTELLRRRREDAPLEWTGQLPARAWRRLEAAGHDPRALLEAAGGAR